MRQNRNFVPPCHGMFPAQIMAVLLIELRKEVKALKARQQLQQQPQGNPNPETPGGGRTIAEEDSSSDRSISSGEQGDSSWPGLTLQSNNLYFPPGLVGRDGSSTRLTCISV